VIRLGNDENRRVNYLVDKLLCTPLHRSIVFKYLPPIYTWSLIETVFAWFSYKCSCLFLSCPCSYPVEQTASCYCPSSKLETIL